MSHEFYINKCIELAKKGMGYVAPNPMVGCVIVKNDQIVSEGWHKKYGDLHAEVNALRSLNIDNTDDTILYCSLEPCSHFTKEKINRPCAPQIIESGIKHVVIGAVDPNPNVAGNGIKMLKEAGITVEHGILAKECDELNSIFRTNILKKRSHVMLKTAQTLDGKVATKTGDSQWITSEVVRKSVHQYRTQYDAVLVGADTVIADNPKLNVRHVEGRNPYRVVIDSTLRSPIDSFLFNDELKDKTIVCTSVNADKDRLKILWDKGIQIIECNVTGNHINLKDMLYRLYERKIYSVFIEGGKSLTTAFLKNGCFDEMLMMIAPKIIGDGMSFVGDLNIEKINDAFQFDELTYETLDNHIIAKGVNHSCSLDL